MTIMAFRTRQIGASKAATVTECLRMCNTEARPIGGCIPQKTKDTEGWFRDYFSS